MSNPNQRLLLSYAMVATIALATGVLLSISDGGTWWLLVLAVLAWVQSINLRRQIHTSGLLLRLFSAVAWTLLGFALVSLLPPVALRLIGDLVVLLILAATFVGPHMRRAR
jgi:hypothetical protein